MPVIEMDANATSTTDGDQQVVLETFLFAGDNSELLYHPLQRGGLSAILLVSARGNVDY